ncbi:hypothetical protein G6F70_007348 [Rhizopus microsporus]|uniref:Copper transport protein n=2 Tax=Rhizopus TaxID=4842 RepID=A0A367JY22_RHIAZ|nr:hypothetical protein G6F71_007354 [Rhizopus microsporus]RCH94818.1 hypothetical protein CU097_011721 [Rhizopus azygosporus]KAG1196566.1 hypothetical protein G6F70_007348 [Rhizopus microsporus]KAG1208727.1 hypothetical protein G6F69_006970 [Rhizopus microsporus]KAG1229647.1 hypothetical protein G6F67_007004 [Rhizopus microsporus]
MDHSGHDMSGMTQTATSTGTAATATPTASHGMSHMMMGAMGTFHWGTKGDGIWINTWVPNSEGAYIGACFGLFFMAVLSRGLPAIEAYYVTWRMLRANKTNQLDTSINESAQVDIEKTPAQNFLRSNALYPSPLKLPTVPPFSWKADTIRSLLSAFSSFISYLLMMVVMTGNGGFFFIIIGGIFVGELAFGRYKALGGFANEHEH